MKKKMMILSGHNEPTCEIMKLCGQFDYFHDIYVNLNKFFFIFVTVLFRMGDNNKSDFLSCLVLIL